MPLPPEVRDRLTYRPGYVVVLETSEPVDTPYSPYLTGEAAFSQQAFVTLPHSFPKDGLSCIGSLWYCLHLPNTFFDLMDLHCEYLKERQNYDYGQQIILSPIDGIERLDPRGIRHHHIIPTFMLAPDHLLARARTQASRLGIKIEVAGFSTLSQELLNRHWREIHESYAPEVKPLGRPPTLMDRLDVAPLLLPAQLLLRQIGDPGRMKIPDTEAALEMETGRALYNQAVMASVARLERERRTPAEASELMDATMAEEGRHVSVPVIVGAPGVSPAYLRKFAPDDRRRLLAPWTRIDADHRLKNVSNGASDYDAERALIECLVAHRAIARTGLGIMTATLPARVFELLAELERHCGSANSVMPRAVWRWIKEIGGILAGMFNDADRFAISRAASLTIFSNFPLGLCILPGDSAPLSCRVPIAYRPTFPLMRALQGELHTPPMVYLGRGFKILIAECIPQSDRVGRLSRSIWSNITEMLREEPSIRVEEVAAANVAEFVEHVRLHKPEVLVLSAHGWFNEDSNAAGLTIGTDRCFGPELGDMPPLVLLSACHVSPRGAGVVNVADLLIRQGATAVLGTQVPVDVRSNALLMNRFFVYVLETLQGREQHRTVGEIWHRVVTGNAFNDILHGSKSFQEWATSRLGSKTVLEAFMQDRSAGRLRLGHMYADTEAVLLEMAEEQGIKNQVQQWLAPGYFPESLFYGFIGWPERIFVADEELASLAGSRERNTEGG